MKYIITIGREYGSGGHFIGKLLAERLGIPFYDNELLLKISEKSGLSNDIISEYDEKKEGLFSSGMNLYSADLSLGSKIFLVQFEEIKRLAEKESCVIVGRCADYVLKDRDNVFKVFLHAPKEFRIKNIMETYGDNAEQAEENIRHSDAARASYYRNVTSQDWGDPHFMDLCLDASLGKEVCAQIIVDAVNAINNK